MATTTAPTAKELSDYSFEELQAHLEQRKASEIASIKKQLDEARMVVLDLEKKLEERSGIPATPKKRGGRPKGSKNQAKTAKTPNATRGKRGALGESILKYLQAKGKEGANYKDIAKALKLKDTQVYSYLAITGKKVDGVKKVDRGSWSYVPKN